MDNTLIYLISRPLVPPSDVLTAALPSLELSSFLAAVTERRREFGIMSSIGLADEVLYFFLVESAVVFVTAYLVGVAAAGIAVAVVIPGITTVASWMQGAALTAMFLPAMAIVGALSEWTGKKLPPTLLWEASKSGLPQQMQP